MLPTSPQKKAITLGYVRVIADAVEALGGNKRALLRSAGIAENRLDQFFEFITLEQYQALLQGALAMTGDPGLGLHIGKKLKFGTHGTFAYAALSFPTAWDALKAGQKFSMLCNHIVSIEMLEESDFYIIRIDTPFITGPLYQTVLEITIGSFCEIFSLKFPDGISAIKISLRYGKPSYGGLYKDILPPEVLFGAESNEIRIPKRIATKKLAMADPMVASLFEKQCDELIANMEADSHDIVDQVRQKLFISKHRFPGLDELAAYLNMSPRTFKRRLQERGTSYRRILDSVRLDIARHYLATTNRSIGDIADILGYEDQNSFSYAFRRLMGLPPTHYRNHCRAQEGG